MAKKKNSDDFDKYDDSFVDKEEFAKPSNGEIEDAEEENAAYEDGISAEDSALCDVLVLNVDITGNEQAKILRFDVIEYDNCGSRHSSRYYCLDMNIGSNGILDMLDDYFNQRFRFLHSSKTCQAFMTALSDIEDSIISQKDTNFSKLCEMLNRNSLGNIIHKDKEEINDKLWDGYGIIKDSSAIYSSKHSTLTEFDFSSLNVELLKRFNFYKEYINTKHFCAICIQYNEECIKPNIIEDPAISLPLIAYIPKFAKNICTKVANNFFNSELFQNLGIGEINTDLYLLMPSATVDDICALYDKNLKIKDFEGIEDNDFIIGKYKTLSFNSGDINTELFDSIIGRR